MPKSLRDAGVFEASQSAAALGRHKTGFLKGPDKVFSLWSVACTKLAYDTLMLIADQSEINAFWKDVEADARLAFAGSQPSDAALWRFGNPLAEQWREAQPILRDIPGGAFWIDWYQRALDGRQQNWPLLRDIVLIDDEIWRQEGSALDEAISERIARHGLQLTEYGEDILADPETGRLRAVPRHDLRPDYLRDVLDKIADALRILPAVAGNSPYAALDPEIELLRDAAQRYSDRPRMLFSTLTRVQRRVEHRLSCGDCVEDAATDDLCATLAELRADLLAYSPQVRESVRRHAELRPASDLPPVGAETLAVVDAVSANFDNYPREEMPQDIRQAQDPAAPAADRVESALRTAGRLLRVRAALLREQTGRASANIRDALIQLGAAGAGISVAAEIMRVAMELLFWLV